MSDPEEGILIESFEYQTYNGLQFTVISDSQESTNELQEAFGVAAGQPAPSHNIIEEAAGAPGKEGSPSKKRSLMSRLSSWKMRTYVMVSLEKIGEGKQAQPKHVASGLALGTKSMLSKVFSAVAGVIVEPVKGAKEGGVKGGAVGFGKGMVGLVCKPVKGTIDLVT